MHLGQSNRVAGACRKDDDIVESLHGGPDLGAWVGPVKG